jgi:hypothetical protein
MFFGRIAPKDQPYYFAMMQNLREQENELSRLSLAEQLSQGLPDDPAEFDQLLASAERTLFHLAVDKMVKVVRVYNFMPFKDVFWKKAREISGDSSQALYEFEQLYFECVLTAQWWTCLLIVQNNSHWKMTRKHEWLEEGYRSSFLYATGVVNQGHCIAMGLDFTASLIGSCVPYQQGMGEKKGNRLRDRLDASDEREIGLTNWTCPVIVLSELSKYAARLVQ